jgi:hypothetical protein
MVRNTLLATMLATLLAACSSSHDNGAGGYSCDQRASEYACTDWQGIAATDTADLNQLKSDCTSNGGTWSSNACPSANRVGSCTIYDAPPLKTIIRWYPPITVDIGKANCPSSTTNWHPG